MGIVRRGSTVRERGMAVLSGLFFFLVLTVMMPFGEATAAIFTVNSTADIVDFNPGDGVCSTTAAVGLRVARVCTLRAAIMEANALPGSDTIILPAGTYTITIPGAGEDAAVAGDLDITGDLTIVGGRPEIIIDGNGLDRVVHILSGIVNISGVTTIRNGNAGPDNGGGVFNDFAGTLTLTNSMVSGNVAAKEGGGIENFGTATLTNVTVRGNTAVDFAGGILNAGTLTLTNSAVSGNTSDTVSFGNGAVVSILTATLTNVTVSGNTGRGIFNSGTLTLTNSTVSGNTASRGGGIENFGTATLTNSAVSGNSASSDMGGGVLNVGTMTLTNSTVSGNSTAFNGGGISSEGPLTLTNSTVSGNSAVGVGGGIFHRNPATATLTNSTVSGNSAGGGGGIFNDITGGAVTLTNTIIANSPSGGNCGGLITSNGNNLDSGVTCGLAGPGDLVNTNPLLGPLANNGGFTMTHALLTGSPAIDAGTNVGCPATDQRGIVRPKDGNGDGNAVCDIGSYEFVRSR